MKLKLFILAAILLVTAVAGHAMLQYWLRQPFFPFGSTLLVGSFHLLILGVLVYLFVSTIKAKL